MMSQLSTDLADMGYERTERQSPFDDDGQLWSNSYELVCDETGFVIRKDESKWTLNEDGLLKLKEQFKAPENEGGN
jgi:hypothetical protein